MDYTNDLVSVIIPTFKRSDMLSRAIHSVLEQTYRDVEVLVVNDNVSPDDEYSQRLYALMDSIEDDRVRLISQPKHINGAAARNAGIREAKGEFIAFLDDDDFWEPGKVEAQVKKLRELGPEWGLATCMNVQRRGDRIVGASLPYRDGDVFIDVLERRIGIGLDAALIRRSAIDTAGVFDETLTRHQDLQLFANLTSQYKVKQIKQYLHNIDSSDGQNRPDAETLIKIKQAYFASIKGLLDRLTPAQRRRVFALNDFEIAFAYMKRGSVSKGLRLAASLLKSPAASYLAVERCVKKFCEKKMYKLLLKKYGS